MFQLLPAMRPAVVEGVLGGECVSVEGAVRSEETVVWTTTGPTPQIM